MDHIQESLSLGRLCCLFCLCLYYFLSSSMSRWYMYFYLDLFATKSGTFFYSCIMTKVRGWKKLTFQAIFP